MLKPLVCPQCGAPLFSGASACSYCRVHFSEPVKGAQPETVAQATETPLPPVPDDWVRYADPWAGFAIAHPPGWEVLCMQGIVSVRQDHAGLCSANIQILRLQAPMTPRSMAQQWIAEAQAYLPGFTAWEVPEPNPTPERLTLRAQANSMGTPLLGTFCIHIKGQDALITGFQAPAQAAASQQRTLETILSSFRPIERLPRQPVREVSEGSHTAWIPQGWQAQMTLNRNNIGGSALLQFRAWRDPNGLVQAAVPWVTWMFQEGFSLFGIPSGIQTMAYQPAVPLAQTFVANWMRQYNPDLQVVEVYDRPDLVPAIGKEVSKTGINPQMLDISCAMLVTAFSEQGVRLRQKARIIVQHQKGGGLMGWMAPSSGPVWTAMMDSYYRAPEQEFPALEPLLAGIIDSVQVNPAWQQMELQRSQNYIMMQQQDIQRRTRQISQTLSESSDILNQAYWNRQESQDRSMHAWSNAMLGYQDMTDHQGTIYNIPTGYDQYWRDGLDNIYGGSLLTNPDPHWVRLDPTGL